MKNIIYFFMLSYFFTNSVQATAPAIQQLRVINPMVAQAAVESYTQGHYRYIQEGQLVQASNVNQEKPSCVLESGKMTLNPKSTYALQLARSLDVDGQAGEIELTFETQSKDPNAYFQIYCFQATPGATLETAREGLKSVFTIQ
jgi:hypothetical protein